MMGFSMKISTWSNLCEKIRNVEQSDWLKCSKQKLESQWTEIADQKNWQRRYCCSTYWVVVDLALSTQYLHCQFFFDQRFQSTKTPVFVTKHFKQLLCSIFLIFSQQFDQVGLLIFSANSHRWRIGINWLHSYVINNKECVTNRCIVFTARAMLALQALY